MLQRTIAHEKAVQLVYPGSEGRSVRCSRLFGLVAQQHRSGRNMDTGVKTRDMAAQHGEQTSSDADIPHPWPYFKEMKIIRLRE